jgi:hypothetical protein
MTFSFKQVRLACQTPRSSCPLIAFGGSGPTKNTRNKLELLGRRLGIKHICPGTSNPESAVGRLVQ